MAKQPQPKVPNYDDILRAIDNMATADPDTYSTVRERVLFAHRQRQQAATIEGGKDYADQMAGYGTPVSDRAGFDAVRKIKQDMRGSLFHSMDDNDPVRHAHRLMASEMFENMDPKHLNTLVRKFGTTPGDEIVNILNGPFGGK